MHVLIQICLAVIAFLLSGVFSIAHAAYPVCEGGYGQITIPKIECEALMDIYNEVPQDRRSNLYNWGTNPDIHSWNGISAYDGHVKDINIYQSHNLSKIPQSIGILSEIVRLQIQGGTFTSIPTEIGNLASLEYLAITNNKNITQIPVSIGQLLSLKTIYLYSLSLSTFSIDLSQLNQLNMISIGGNLFVDIPMTLFTAPNLENLYLNSGKINKIPSNLPIHNTLKYISFESNKISTIEDDFSGVANLTTLNLDNNKLTQFPEFDSTTSNIVTLSVQNNSFLELPSNLFSFPKLENLFLGDNQIILLPNIPTGSKIKQINLQNNPLQYLPTTIDNLIDLEYLNVAHSNLSQLPNSIGGLLKLNSLNISYSKLYQLPDNFGNLSNLRDLQLNNNELVALPSTLIDLQNLYNMNLQSNNLTGFIPSLFIELKNLKYLNLQGNNLSGRIPEMIGSIDNLSVLNLSENMIENYLPESLKKLRETQYINLSVDFYLPQYWWGGGYQTCWSSGGSSSSFDSYSSSTYECEIRYIDVSEQSIVTSSSSSSGYSTEIGSLSISIDQVDVSLLTTTTSDDTVVDVSFDDAIVVEDSRLESNGFQVAVTSTHFISDTATIPYHAVQMKVDSVESMLDESTTQGILFPAAAYTSFSGNNLKSNPLSLLQIDSSADLPGAWSFVPSAKIQIPKYTPAGEYSLELTYSVY